MSCTVDPRSGMPGIGIWKCLPWNENDSWSSARRMISIDSSNTSRLSSSAAAWSGLSCEPIETPLSLRCRTSRGTVPRPTPSIARPPDRLCSVAKSSARRSGFHCGTTLNIAPKRRSLRLCGDPRRDQQPVGDHLVALVLEVVLGRPERVEPESFGLVGGVDVVERGLPALLVGVAAIHRIPAARRRRRPSRRRRRRTLRSSLPCTSTSEFAPIVAHRGWW